MQKLFYEQKNFKLYQGSNLEVLPTLPNNSVDSIVTDPPYELGFMGKTWDNSGIAYSVELWKQCLRVLKPGGHLIAFSGSRTYHRMAVAIEDAGFEIRDQLMWLYGSGFPKAQDVSKQIDKKQVQLDWFADWFNKYLKDNNIPTSKIQDMFLSKTGGRTGMVSNWLNKVNQPTLKQFNKLVKELNLPFDNVEELERKVISKYKSSAGFTIRNIDESAVAKDGKITEPNSDEAKQWDGWKSALKPAHEPMVLARKPFEKGLNTAQNILKWGVGALNIDESRIVSDDTTIEKSSIRGKNIVTKIGDNHGKESKYFESGGRYPANVITDGSEEVISKFPNETNRFFYGAKAQSDDRDQGLDNFESKKVWTTTGQSGSFDIFEQDKNGRSPRKNIHPTVKPTNLMRYLIRLVTPKNGVVLDPFMGSGSTGKGAMVENINNDKNYTIIGIELTEEYLPIARDRVIKGATIFAQNEKYGKPKKQKVEKNQVSLINDLF